jgi:formyltetrahydrofolate deformylase
MILTIQCNDQVGLVAAISKYLSGRGINITSMREHVDTEAGRFFARLQVEGGPATDERGEFKKGLTEGLASVLPQGTQIEVIIGIPKRVVVLVTREHHCLSDLLIRHHFQTAGMQIQCVIGNHPDLGDLCTRFGVPFFQVSHENKTKAEFEGELLAIIDRHPSDLLILAKFMRILSPEFVRKFPMKIVNIHHSFLPAFIGSNPYRQAHERGVKLIGATAHFVTDSLDEGPILTQQIIPVDHTFGVQEMIRSGKEIEVAVLAEALRLVCEDRAFVQGNKTVIFK